MTKTALKWAGQTGTKHRNQDDTAGPVTRMTHNQAQLGAGGERDDFEGIATLGPPRWVCQPVEVRMPGQ